jgi:hypothetical protein
MHMEFPLFHSGKTLKRLSFATTIELTRRACPDSAAPPPAADDLLPLQGCASWGGVGGHATAGVSSGCHVPSLPSFLSITWRCSSSATPVVVCLAAVALFAAESGTPLVAIVSALGRGLTQFAAWSRWPVPVPVSNLLGASSPLPLLQAIPPCM